MKKRVSAVCVACLLLAQAAVLFSLLGCTVAVSANAGRPPYIFAIEHMMGDSSLGVGGSMIAMKRDVRVPQGTELVIQGWVATGEGISAYEYLWVPAGGGAASWQKADAEIYARKDLAGAGIEYRSGHATAGFRVTLTPPDGTTAGYYDVYLRAVDGTDSPCDLLALLRLQYGHVDADNEQTVLVNFSRVAAQGGDSLRDAAVTDAGITLAPGGRVRLGTYNLGGFAQVRITYATKANSHVAGRPAILGLKSDGDYSFGMPNTAYNMTDALAWTGISTFADVTASDVTAVAVIDLTQVEYAGDVWLTAYCGDDMTVKAVEFVYTEFATDRVAAKIHLAGALAFSSFTGPNHVSASGVTDPALGEVLRIEVMEDTNDPFIHFHAGSVLKEYDIKLSADEYKYLVVLARAPSENLHTVSTFYLCSGSITGATEACTHTFHMEKDGRWHYYLLDLSKTENWTGIINGWRFDIINGESPAGNAVEYASVQFFRTPESARVAAAQDPAKATPYRAGDPTVELDMSEESASMENVVIRPEDTYVVTEPATAPEPGDMTDTALPSETLPSADTGTAAPSEPSSETERSGANGSGGTRGETGGASPGSTGCASAAGGVCLLIVTAGAGVAARNVVARKKHAAGTKNKTID